MEPKETIDIFTVSITIGIAVFGWLISLLLQRKNLKDQHRIQVKYDIYKEFVLLRKEAVEDWYLWF
jgi:low affinity Fe/Cu permease